MAVAHFLQRQDGLRSLSGTASKAATSIVTVEHQHGVSKLPLLAGAQSFNSPQPGHTRFGFGNMEGCLRSDCRHCAPFARIDGPLIPN
jgi:hypothetical protein